jgi:hypothetical protein
MTEARPPRWPAWMRPALGSGGHLPRRVRTRRSLILVALILLLGTAKLAVGQGIIKVQSDGPSGLVVTQGLLIGTPPTDEDLIELAADYRVDGVVNLSTPSIAEQVTAASLHQAYLYLPLASHASPTWPDLRELAAFMRAHTAGGTSVYVYDNAGGGPSVTTAAMLLLLRGQAWPAVSAELTAADLNSMCDCQRRALRELRSALDPAGPALAAANPYAAVRLDSW